MIRKPETKVIIIAPVAKIPVAQVLKTLQGTHKKVNFYGEYINTNTLKLRTFKKSGCICVSCGLKGEYFTLDKNHKNEKLYHLNMYAEVNGEEILFNKDHIIPKSAGGADVIHNMQTMCQECNQIKGALDHKANMVLLKKLFSKEEKESINTELREINNSGLRNITKRSNIGLLRLSILTKHSGKSVKEIKGVHEIDKLSKDIIKISLQEGRYTYFTDKAINLTISKVNTERVKKLKELRVIQGVV